jgi:OmpA-OmpF porin, OOP family
MTPVRIAALAGLAALALALPAKAQVTTHRAEGFALERFYPADPGSRWLAGDALDFRGHKRTTLGVVLDWARKPLVLYGPAGSEIPLVSNQFYGHLGGSVALWNRVRLSLWIPVILYEGGRSFFLDDTEYAAPHGLGLGDVRLGASALAWARADGVVRLGGGLRFFIPSAGRDSYASDGTVRIEPHVNVAGDVDGFTYAARLGVQIRPQSPNYAGTELGSEFLVGLAAGYQTPGRRVLVGAELLGSTVFSRGDSYFDSTASPLELLAISRLRLPRGWSLSAGIGPGLTRALGTPRFRCLFGAEWFFPRAE